MRQRLRRILLAALLCLALAFGIGAPAAALACGPAGCSGGYNFAPPWMQLLSGNPGGSAGGNGGG